MARRNTLVIALSSLLDSPGVTLKDAEQALHAAAPLLTTSFLAELVVAAVRHTAWASRASADAVANAARTLAEGLYAHGADLPERVRLRAAAWTVIASNRAIEAYGGTEPGARFLRDIVHGAEPAPRPSAPPRTRLSVENPRRKQKRRR